MIDILHYDKEDNVNYRMHNVFLNNKVAMYSVYYDGEESTARYSVFTTHEYF